MSDRSEKILAGILGVIAVVAAICEMIVGGMDCSAILGAIKDVSGTLVTIFVFIAVVKDKKKVAKDFIGTFKNEMNKIIEKYTPIVSETESPHIGKVRYNISKNLSDFYSGESGESIWFFDFSPDNGFEFRVTKTLLGGQKLSNDVFVEMQKKIFAHISTKTESVGLKFKFDTKTKDTLKIKFNNTLTSEKEAIDAARIVDIVVLVLLAEYKEL